MWRNSLRLLRPNLFVHRQRLIASAPVASEPDKELARFHLPVEVLPSSELLARLDDHHRNKLAKIIVELEVSC
jgi:hypothetical protein